MGSRDVPSTFRKPVVPAAVGRHPAAVGAQLPQPVGAGERAPRDRALPADADRSVADLRLGRHAEPADQRADDGHLPVGPIVEHPCRAAAGDDGVCHPIRREGSRSGPRRPGRRDRVRARRAGRGAAAGRPLADHRPVGGGVRHAEGRDQSRSGPEAGPGLFRRRHGQANRDRDRRQRKHGRRSERGPHAGRKRHRLRCRAHPADGAGRGGGREGRDARREPQGPAVGSPDRGQQPDARRPRTIRASCRVRSNWNAAPGSRSKRSTNSDVELPPGKTRLFLRTHDRTARLLQVQGPLRARRPGGRPDAAEQPGDGLHARPRPGPRAADRGLGTQGASSTTWSSRLRNSNIEVTVQPSDQLFTSLAELQPYDSVDPGQRAPQQRLRRRQR